MGAGNLGTIVRSAVQSNVFEEIWVVEAVRAKGPCRGLLAHPLRRAAARLCHRNVWAAPTCVGDVNMTRRARAQPAGDGLQGGGGSGARGGDSTRRGASDDELNYYSVQNAPLIEGPSSF
eukprot:SAG11_NODE_12800_length_684_cov_9.131624_1_plen_119_part_10